MRAPRTIAPEIRTVAIADSLDAESIRILTGLAADERTPARQLAAQLRSFEWPMVTSDSST
jgi:hypothetical protein